MTESATIWLHDYDLHPSACRSTYLYRNYEGYPTVIRGGVVEPGPIVKDIIELTYLNAKKRAEENCMFLKDMENHFLEKEYPHLMYQGNNPRHKYEKIDNVHDKDNISYLYYIMLDGWKMAWSYTPYCYEDEDRPWMPENPIDRMLIKLDYES